MPTDVPFQTSTGFLISQLGVLATRSWMDVLAQRDLTPHHHAILLTLLAAGPMGATALADATLVDPRNMGPVLTPLERRGLISRSDDPTDRRRRTVELTDSGVAAAKELAVAAGSIEEDLLAPLDTTQRDALRRHLLLLWQHARSTPDEVEPRA
ncbi:MarR family winged helix-turn-helix transcriptional regulator [Microbacterium gorillae]|uniref:MarR family winged helix-turn-helix transcriptional regulator n=1 Tax=Microbacterium gorillae TaxID=1231063 RepID=UPI0018A859CE|nr:MarR family transcriptional regulator [Microbacterium gorillae]